jgi:hypothetical protein
LERHPDHEKKVGADPVLTVVYAFHPKLDENVDAGVAERFDFGVWPLG